MEDVGEGLRSGDATHLPSGNHPAVVLHSLFLPEGDAGGGRLQLGTTRDNAVVSVVFVVAVVVLNLIVLVIVSLSIVS